jgi:hypothetical protein
VKNYNGVKDHIKFCKRGELASNREEEQELGMLCLHILQSCFGMINTLMIQDTLALPEWQDVLTDVDRRGLTPGFHTNMTPYGEIPIAYRPAVGSDRTSGTDYSVVCPGRWISYQTKISNRAARAHAGSGQCSGQ